MKLNRRTRFCCVAVIVAGFAVVGHAVVAERGITLQHQNDAKQATGR